MDITEKTKKETGDIDAMEGKIEVADDAEMTLDGVELERVTGGYPMLGEGRGSYGQGEFSK